MYLLQTICTTHKMGKKNDIQYMFGFDNTNKYYLALQITTGSFINW